MYILIIFVLVGGTYHRVGGADASGRDVLTGGNGAFASVEFSSKKNCEDAADLIHAWRNVSEVRHACVKK